MVAFGALPTPPIAPYWIALLVCALYGASLWALDLYTPPEVRHWKRLAQLRGLEGSRGLGQRVGERLPVLRAMREELDIGLLLSISGSDQSTESWLVGTVGGALAAAALVAVTDAFALAQAGALAVPLWVTLVVILATLATRYVSLRRAARIRQAKIGEQLGDALLGLAVLVPGIPADDALALLARCQVDGRLVDAIDEQKVRSLLGDEALLKSTRERYLLIGQALRIPLFQELSQLMRGIETEGLSAREEYPALSRISAENRLMMNRIRAARARTGAAAAIALLLIPLLMLVGGGIAFAFLGAVNG